MQERNKEEGGEGRKATLMKITPGRAAAAARTLNYDGDRAIINSGLTFIFVHATLCPLTPTSFSIPVMALIAPVHPDATISRFYTEACIKINLERLVFS